jgi:hypothetical protein
MGHSSIVRETRDTVEEIHHDTREIKEDTQAIIEEIAKLQAKLAGVSMNENGQSEFMLQRYLEQLTDYAPTIVGDNDTWRTDQRLSLDLDAVAEDGTYMHHSEPLLSEIADRPTHATIDPSIHSTSSSSRAGNQSRMDKPPSQRNDGRPDLDEQSYDETYRRGEEVGILPSRRNSRGNIAPLPNRSFEDLKIEHTLFGRRSPDVQHHETDVLPGRLSTATSTSSSSNIGQGQPDAKQALDNFFGERPRLGGIYHSSPFAGLPPPPGYISRNQTPSRELVQPVQNSGHGQESADNTAFEAISFEEPEQAEWRTSICEAMQKSKRIVLPDDGEVYRHEVDFLGTEKVEHIGPCWPEGERNLWDPTRASP